MINERKHDFCLFEIDIVHLIIISSCISKIFCSNYYCFNLSCGFVKISVYSCSENKREVKWNSLSCLLCSDFLHTIILKYSAERKNN